MDPVPASNTDLPRPPRLPGRRTVEPRRPVLTLDAIIEAGIDVLETDGVDSLSMRLVAARLATGPASLYAYVAGKEELLELIFDELVSRVPVPAPDPDRWQQQLTGYMTDLRAMLRTNSQVALAGLGRIPLSAKGLASAESVLSLLNAAGLKPRVVALGVDLLAQFVIAGVFEDSLYERKGLPDGQMEDYVREIREFYAALPVDRYPVMAMMAEELTGADGEERFRFGVDVLIAGLVALSQRS